MTSMSMMSGRKLLTTNVQGINKQTKTMTANTKLWGSYDVCCFKASSIKVLKQQNRKNSQEWTCITQVAQTQRSTASDSNPEIQQSKIHPITKEAGGPVIPVTMILGTSRIVPNDAVLRWPRLYRGRAAKTHTYTHTAAYTTSMQNKRQQVQCMSADMRHKHAHHPV